MRVGVAAASLLAALAAASPAWAKEPIRATFCGASGCRTFEDRATLNRIPGGEGTVPLGPAVPYYRVEMVNGEPNGGEHSFYSYYVPSANAMAFEEPEGVMRYHPIFGAPTINLMRRLTRGLEPFPRPVVTRANDGERLVRPSPWTDEGIDLQYSPGASSERSWRLAFAAVPLGLLGLAVALRGRTRRT